MVVPIEKIIGVKFGELIPIEEAERDKRGKRQFLCKCSCGTEKIILMNQLRTGKTKTCGCRATLWANRMDIAGRKFGRLTAVREAEPIIYPKGHRRRLYH